MSRSQFICGQSWTGDLPEGWRPLKAKRVFAQSKLRAMPGDVQLSVTQKHGIVAQEELIESGQRVVLALSGTDNFKHVEVDDFVISLRSFQGGIEWSRVSGCVSPAYTVLRAERPILPSYWGYLFKSTAFITALRSVIDEGIRDGKSITYEQFGETTTPFPPICEQEAIASHLDRATFRIDTLVAKKTRFIELLREKRQALITHAVTKGLDPNVPMKDSGVEWLGEVPETWDAAPLKSFLQLRRHIVGSESSNTKLLSLTLQGVIERDLENPTGKMPASFDGYQRISAGEMVFCLFDMDETPRTVGVAPQDGMLTAAYTVFRPQSELWARYLYYFFLHVDEYKRLRPFYKGLRKTIRPGPFLSIQVPRPTEREAKAIVAHLDRVTSRIDTLIAKTERSIELLREHRTALITAAVTGKIDLRATA